VPPLVATLAATFAVGVGVAIARNGRDRRARTPPPPEPHFALLPDEPLARGMRRIALEQCDLAIALLGGAGGRPDEHAVHETRKALKRLRALVRLLEDDLGEEAYARESAALRDVAARLAGARDAEVMVETVDALVRRHPRRLRRSRGVRRLRKRLAAAHRRARAATLDDTGQLLTALAEMRAFRTRVSGWQLSERKRMRLVEDGVQRIYAGGRKRGRRAVRAKRRRRDAAMHEWRKRVKDLRYVSEALQRREAAARRHAPSANGRVRAAPSKRLARTASRADQLGELLGEDHDLALLAQLIRKGRGDARVPRGTRRVLLKLIARRQRRLRRRALLLGERLYRRPPKKFVRRVRAEYARQARPLS
jgi:CHAD domain-containing protein